MTITLIFMLIISFVWVSHGVEIFYSDIVAANKTCDLKDSCTRDKPSRMGEAQDWRRRNCFCDDLCRVYGDCCVDASVFDAEEQKSGLSNFECVGLKIGNVYMKRSCPLIWSENSIREMCERKVGVNDDPFGHIPVTSHRTSLTYRSYYCAICNEDSNRLTFWQPMIACPALTGYSQQFRNITADWIASHLEFEKVRKVWGVRVDTGGVEVFHDCSIDPVFPEIVQHYVRRCKEAINVCVDDWKDAEIRNKCEAYTAYVYSAYQTFRNVHCALCNFKEVDDLYCFERLVLGRGTFMYDFHPVSFSVLFDMNNLQGDGNVVGQSIKCREGEMYDPFFKKCRDIMCGSEDKVFRQGRCIDLTNNHKENIPEVPKESITGSVTSIPINTVSVEIKPDTGTTENGTVTNIPALHKKGSSSERDWNSTNIETNVSGDGREDDSLNNNTSTLSQKELSKVTESSFESCPKVLLDPSEYNFKDNNTIYVPGYNRTFGPGEFTLMDLKLMICAIGISEMPKFDSTMGYVTIICMGVSVVCLLMHLSAFLLVPDLQNLSGKNLASLCLALLGTYSTNISSQFLQVATATCTVVAIIMYYCCLSAFFWMLIMAFDVWRTLRLATSELRISAGRQWKKFIAYSSWAWLFPALIVAAAVGIENVSPNTVPTEFRPQFGVHVCWFSNKKALMLFFAAPLAVIMVINIVLFTLSISMIMATTVNMTNISCNSAQQNCKLYFRLALLMGLTWITGLIATYVESVFVWYIFILLNTLQGLLIFLFFTCSKKVYRAIKDKICPEYIIRFISYCWKPDSSETRKHYLESRDSNDSRSSQTSQNSLATSRMSLNTTNTHC